ncbi:DUF2568 domain-containing protein [Nocardia brevicatena]|uniref:DUF2568 domain-containing protein n=1 Tax=Nocardia brevicatena TaxID=37327 RepID=UPI0002DE534C|nr:DUF2568 domain-containing protein [Nocardia brevicatena]
MSLRPALLGVRFLLEVSAVVSFGVLGRRCADSPWRWLLVLALPMVTVALWGVIAVPETI